MALATACSSLATPLVVPPFRQPSAAHRPEPHCQTPCNAAPLNASRQVRLSRSARRSGLTAESRGNAVASSAAAAALSSSFSSFAAHPAALFRGPFLPPRQARRSACRIEARRRETGIEPAQRIVAGLAYLLPLLDGIRYGRFLFLQFPVTEVILQPILPLVQLYNSVPFSSLVAFFGLYLLVVNNQNYSRYVRFNCYQAILLDILLILPGLVERTFSPSSGIGLEFLVVFYNTVFLFIFACFLFGSVSCLLGKEPRLPVVADAADAQVPF